MTPSQAAAWFDALSNLSATAILGLVVLGFVKGWIYPAHVVNEIVKSRDWWREQAQDSMKVWRRLFEDAERRNADRDPRR